MNKFKSVVCFGLNTIVLLLCLSSCVHVKQQKYTDLLDKSKLTLFAKILDLEEEVVGDVNREQAHQRIGEILIDLEQRLRAVDTPKQKIDQIALYLFKEKKIESVDPHSFQLEDDLAREVAFRLNFITSVLNQSVGMCITLVELYLIIGEYFNIPFYFAVSPDHVFVQYNDGKQIYNIETTDGGKIINDADFSAYYKTDKKTQLRSGLLEIYHKPIQILGSIYFNLTSHFLQDQNKTALAKLMAVKAINLGHTLIWSGVLLAVATAIEGRQEQAIDRLKVLQTANPENAFIPYGLGIVHLVRNKPAFALNMFKKSFKKGYEKAADVANRIFPSVRASTSPSSKEILKFSGKQTYVFRLDPKWLRLKQPNRLKIYLGENNHAYIDVTYAFGLTVSERTAAIEHNVSEGQVLSTDHPTCSVLIRGIDKHKPYYSCHLFRKNKNGLLNFELVIKDKTFDSHLPEFSEFVKATKAY